MDHVTRNGTPSSSSATRVVDVLVPVAINQTYSYRVPRDMEIAPGDVVTVPLGAREVIAVVWAENPTPDPRLHNRLMDIGEKIDVPPLREELRTLVDWVAKGMIGVLPSVWYEPMGGVAVELLAAGKSLIVSARGGLAECVGDAGLTFPNGNDEALAAQMLRVLEDPALRAGQAAKARERAAGFMPGRFVAQYIDMLGGIARKA